MSWSNVGAIMRRRSTMNSKTSLRQITQMMHQGHDHKIHHLSFFTCKYVRAQNVTLLMKSDCRNVQIHLFMLYKSFIDQPASMKVKSLDSDNDDENHPRDVEVKNPKKELNQSKQASHASQLVYPPGASKAEKEQTINLKAQPKTEVKLLKNELKIEKNIKKALVYHGQHEKKKEVERLAYPPLQKQIPLKVTKTAEKGDTKFKDVVEETITEAKIMIHKMRSLYKKDLDKFSKGQLAYHKVKYLKYLGEKLSNVYVKRQFIEHKGLKQIERWLNRITDEDNNQFEPSLALRVGLTKILKDMNLTPEQIEKTKYLMTYVQRNRMSQVQELRELSIDLVKQWQYNIMTENNQDSKK